MTERRFMSPPLLDWRRGGMSRRLTQTLTVGMTCARAKTPSRRFRISHCTQYLSRHPNRRAGSGRIEARLTLLAARLRRARRASRPRVFTLPNAPSRSAVATRRRVPDAGAQRRHSYGSSFTGSFFGPAMADDRTVSRRTRRRRDRSARPTERFLFRRRQRRSLEDY